MNSIHQPALYQPWPLSKTLKLMIVAVVIMGAGMSSQRALAACTVDGPIDRVMTTPSTGWQVEVDGSGPVGSFLKLIRFNSTAPEITVTCDEGPLIIASSSDYPLVSTNPEYNLYDSGIPGISIGFFIRVGDYGQKVPRTAYIENGTYTTPLAFANEIAIFKTGEILTGGQILPDHIAVKLTLQNKDNLNFMNVRLQQPITVTIVRPTCAATPPMINVNLGEVSVADFNPAGRTTPKDFNIVLTCTGGSGTRDVHVTLTDANNPGNMTSQLGLSPDSSAQGIALEVNNKFGAVTFGPDLEGIGNPGQWLEGAAGVGSFSIPLSVNYVRLPGPIKGGTANSGVTYTLNYD